MLSKKQYLWTLMVAIGLFIVIFLVTYFSICLSNKNTNVAPENVAELNLSEPWQEKNYVLPQTKIILRTQSIQNKLLSEARLDATPLLGYTEDEVADRFKGYTIETFNEDEVTLIKTIETEEDIDEGQKVYTLGIEDGYVCIKEKDSTSRPVKIDYEESRCSQYVHQLLSAGIVEITSAQKEALLLNASTLQRILQNYVED